MANTDQARSRGMWGRRRGEPAPESDGAIRRTEPVTDGTEGNGTMTGDDDTPRDNEPEQRPDPAPTAAAVAEDRAQQLVGNITTHTLAELRGLREQLDDLMREMAERRAQISEAIRGHAEFAESAIQHKIIIGESIAKLRADFERSRTPLPPMRNV